MEEKNNYKETAQIFKRYGIHDDPALWQAFTLGLTAKGFIPGDRLLTLKVCELLNDSNPLPGEIIALITGFAIDAEEMLKNGHTPKLMLPSSDEKPQARLYALAQSAYGLSLGLSCDLKGFDDITDKDLKDDLKTLIQIGKLDTDSDELDEDDFKSVKDFMENLSLSFFKKRPSFITVKD